MPHKIMNQKPKTEQKKKQSPGGNLWAQHFSQDFVCVGFLCFLFFSPPCSRCKLPSLKNKKLPSRFSSRFFVLFAIPKYQPFAEVRSSNLGKCFLCDMPAKKVQKTFSSKNMFSHGCLKSVFLRKRHIGVVLLFPSEKVEYF